MCTGNIVELAATIGSEAAGFRMHDQRGMDYVVQQARRNGLAFYEPPLPKVLMALAQASTGVFLDVGANTGLYSLLAAAANSNLLTYAFEPIAEIRALLSRNLDANEALASRIRIVPAALSDRTGVVQMQKHVNPEGLIATSSTLEMDIEHALEYSLVNVDILTLDHWTHTMAVGDVGFLKIDVEGHEQAVIRGATETLRRDRPFIAIELLGSANFDFFHNFLQETKYIDLALQPEKVTRLTYPKFMPDAWNHMFCPQERAWDFAATCETLGLSID